MNLHDRLGQKLEQAPVNPWTGAPNGELGTKHFGALHHAAPSTSSGSMPYTPAERLEGARRFFEWSRAVIESRVVAASVLGALSFILLGGNLLIFFLVFCAGWIVLDRFVNARCIITIGGTVWLLAILIGALIDGSIRGPFIMTFGSIFTFFGFLLALSVCGAFFAGRYMFRFGYSSGQLDTDAAVAQHITARFVDKSQGWDAIDGGYLEVEGALSRMRDVQQAAEQALRDEARRKDDLITYLAHDLKTPLASIVGYLSLLEEAPDLPVEQRVRFTGVALDKAHRLDALIEEFFDITRFDFHDIVLTRSYIDLSLLLAQVADEFYPILSEQRKTVEVAIEPGFTVLVDGDKIARVFNNIMRNAVSYSYEGTAIRVCAHRSDGVVSIQFENQGDPIPEPKRKVIFEKFYRLDAARATNRGGAGLGLAIAKEIVVAHGGEISCDSTPERTVFTVTLPTASETS